jgi:hypothetical protein
VADDAHDLALTDVEVDAEDDLLGAIAGLQAGYFQQRLAGPGGLGGHQEPPPK